MRVLFITIAWPALGERNLYSDLMDEFRIRGHSVTVICTDETKTRGQKATFENGHRIVRVASIRIKKAGYMTKAFSLLMLGTTLKRAIANHLAGQAFDLIVTHTPPITLSRLLAHLKQLHRARVYLLLKDIWPQGSIDLGIFTKDSIVARYFRFHERRMYEVADHIGCMSPMNADYIIRKNAFVCSSKVNVCPNSIRPREVMPAGLPSIRRRFGIPDDAVVFIFSGNLAKGHGLEFLVRAIEALRFFKKAFFLVGGGGTHFSYLKHETNRRQLPNVILYERLPVKDFEKLMGEVDVGIILLDRRLTIPQFPSRLLSYLEYSLPVLCAVNSETDIGEIVEESGSGLAVLHGDIAAFTNAVIALSEEPTLRGEMGKNARRLLEERFTVANSYEVIMLGLSSWPGQN